VRAEVPSIPRHLRELQKRLMAKAPPSRPVRVVIRSKESEDFGFCSLGPKGYSIYVHLRVRDAWHPRGRAVTVAEAADTLVHEWAHALAWPSQHDDSNGHDGAWGRAYAKAYRVSREERR
jgi:hypothetical protein